MCHPKDEAKVPSASPFASVAQLVEQRTENPRVVGSIPTGGTIPRRFSCGGPKCECSSSGRAPPCQGGGSEFEPRHSLQSFSCAPSPGRHPRRGLGELGTSTRAHGVPWAHEIRRCGPRKSDSFCGWRKRVRASSLAPNINTEQRVLCSVFHKVP